MYMYMSCNNLFMYMYIYIYMYMYVKAVGNKGVLDDKMPFWTFSQAGRAPTVLFT